MTSQATNKFSRELRDRSVRLMLEQEGKHPSRWAAVQSIAGKVGCSPHTLLAWVKRADRDAGRAPGVPSAGEAATVLGHSCWPLRA